jgi:hypothetical protein
MLNEQRDVPEHGRICIRILLPESISACAGHSGAFVELFSIARADRLTVFVYSTMALMRMNLEVAASTFVVQPPAESSHLFTLSR